jgi:hypothetical protein
MRFTLLAFRDKTSPATRYADIGKHQLQNCGDCVNDINHEDHEGLEDGLGSIRPARTRVQHPCLLHDLHALHVSCFWRQDVTSHSAQTATSKHQLQNCTVIMPAILTMKTTKDLKTA